MCMGAPSVSQFKDRFQPLHVAPAQNYLKTKYKFIWDSQSYLYVSKGSVLVAQGSDIPKWFPHRCIPDTIHRQLSSAFDTGTCTCKFMVTKVPVPFTCMMAYL